MRSFILTIACSFLIHIACAQKDSTGKFRFIIGVSAPELLHLGFTYRLADISQLGLNGGGAPSWGEIWWALSLEHRLYVGKNDKRLKLKSWFFRQGTTYFPSARPPQRFTLNLTVGKDLVFKNLSGLTVDAGVFFLRTDGTFKQSFKPWPALRFEFYFSN
jgi:hypothetical protein